MQPTVGLHVRYSTLFANVGHHFTSHSSMSDSTQNHYRPPDDSIHLIHPLFSLPIEILTPLDHIYQAYIMCSSTVMYMPSAKHQFFQNFPIPIIKSIAYSIVLKLRPFDIDWLACLFNLTASPYLLLI
jgi:hypothetical protein